MYQSLGSVKCCILLRHNHAIEEYNTFCYRHLFPPVLICRVGLHDPHHLIQIGSKHSTIKEVITSSLEVKHLTDGWINGGCTVRKVREPAGKRFRLEKGNFICLLRPVWRGGVSRSRQIIGAEWCTGAGSARWSPLKIRREVL